MENKTIYRKLHEARKYIKTCGIEKKGKNTFSNYDYFTPEQISMLVFEACEDQGLIHTFNLIRNESSYTGFVKIFDIDNPANFIEFTMATGIPEIKATNITQQLGGAVTYTERYLLMTAFDIKDNNLDFDSKDNTKSATKKNDEKTNEPEKWLNKYTSKAKDKASEEYWKVLNGAKSKGLSAADLRKYYKINKEVFAEIEADLNC